MTTQDRDAVPAHVAIIMDGNGRWTKKEGLVPFAGHRAGVEAIREVLRACRAQGVSVVTLFAFSSENWKRPGPEVTALMRLFSDYLDGEVERLRSEGVRLRFIGRRDRLSKALVKRMAAAEKQTEANTEQQLVIAVDYGGQWDIANAAQQLAVEVAAGNLSAESVDEAALAQHMCLADLPAPDLCIRTAGEQRISNFLLWQLAYSELYFSNVLWPDFGEQQIDEAIAAYAERERRFGGRL